MAARLSNRRSSLKAGTCSSTTLKASRTWHLYGLPFRWIKRKPTLDAPRGGKDDRRNYASLMRNYQVLLGRLNPEFTKFTTTATTSERMKTARPMYAGHSSRPEL
jgi:hypothetical protein